MPNTTTNYNLVKPLASENYDIDVFNGNADIIDDTLNDLEQNKVDKIAGKGLSTEDYTSAEKTKLSTVQSGAEPNQNAISSILVSSQPTITSDEETETIELVQGSNVTITTDNVNKKITISATGTLSGTTEAINVTVADSGNFFSSGSVEGSLQEVGEALNDKQDVLVSGTNIKTINGNSVLGSGDLVIESGDWKSINATLTYASADSPTFVANTSIDLTAVISVGMKIKLTQSTVKYFIVTAITSTTITLYGGTDYTLANATITLPFVSSMKAPFGFPMNQDKWSIITTDTTLRTQASPTANTWYNSGGINITIPIGLWILSYKAKADAERSTAGGINIFQTLSTANNTESDPDFTTASSDNSAVSLNGLAYFQKEINLSSKTTYYLNHRTMVSGLSSILFTNNQTKCIIKAVCAYL